MLQVGFEPTIPEFGRVKTVHALGHVVTVIGRMHICTAENNGDS
jgi:hypothetical protein